MSKSISSQVELLEIPAAAPRCGIGSLQAGPDRKLPLASVKIQAQVIGSVLDVEMQQSFRNTYDTALEATYIFPLPGAAAVYQFELKIADRLVMGEVQERQAAQQNYQQALEKGHRAALMQQERDDVYTLQVGNIPAGESVSICLKYVQQLDYRAEGLYECRLPMVVAPRYIPGTYTDADLPAGQGTASDTQIVPDASRISPPRLLPGFDPEIDFKLEISLQTARGISDLVCSQHASRTQIQPDLINVSLAQQEALNRDFVLRWRTATTEPTQHTLYYAKGYEADQGYGLIELQAPAPAFLQDQRREVLFLLDRSGSMGDYKMAAAAQACERLLNSLSPGDAFAIQAFDDRLEWLTAHNDSPHAPGQSAQNHQAAERWLAADQAGKDQGRRFLQAVTSRGGTELYQAISEGLQLFSKQSNSLPVIVLLTDGQVGDESRILKKIQTEIGQALIHTIGIDTAVNDSFLKRLAQLGGGSHLSVTPREDLAQALEGIAAEIGFPVLQNIQLNLPQLTPDPIPNLYAGRSLSLFFKGACPEQLSLKTQNSDATQAIEIKAVEFPALAQLWAHSRLQQLEDRFRLAAQADKTTLKNEMIQISCAQQILCRLTAWLAIDQQAVIQDAGPLRKIMQPVALPADWQEPLQEQMICAAPPPPSMTLRGSVYSTASTASFDQALPSPAPMARAAAAPESAKLSRKRAQVPFAESAPGQSKPSRGEGFLQKAEAFLGGGGSNAPGAATPPAPISPAAPIPVTRADSSSAARVVLPQQLITGIAQFLNALSELVEALNKGGSPDAAPLQKYSQTLKNDLASSDQAEHLPQTQRLLRQENQQLLQALAAGHVQGLEPLLKRIHLQIAQVQHELKQFSSAAPAEPASSPVWEQSI